MVTARTKARRRAKRRAAIGATVRSLGQLLSVLVGGGLTGGLLVLAAFPDTTGPVPPAGCVAAAGFVALATCWWVNRLRPPS